MCLDVVDLPRLDTCVGAGGPQDRGLGRWVWRHQPVGPTVLVDRRAAHHGQDSVAVAECLESRLSTTTPQPRRARIVRARIEGSAPTGRRQGSGRVEAACNGWRQNEIDPCRDDEIALPPLRRLLAAMWIATSDDEQAVSTVTDGPRTSRKYDKAVGDDAQRAPVPLQASIRAQVT